MDKSSTSGAKRGRLTFRKLCIFSLGVVLLSIGLGLYLLLSPPAGRPSWLRYLLVREGMTRMEVETELGPGSQQSDPIRVLEFDREQLIKDGEPAEDVDLILRW